MYYQTSDHKPKAKTPWHLMIQSLFIICEFCFFMNKGPELNFSKTSAGSQIPKTEEVGNDDITIESEKSIVPPEHIIPIALEGCPIPLKETTEEDGKTINTLSDESENTETFFTNFQNNSLEDKSISPAYLSQIEDMLLSKKNQTNARGLNLLLELVIQTEDKDLQAQFLVHAKAQTRLFKRPLWNKVISEEARVIIAYLHQNSLLEAQNHLHSLIQNNRDTVYC